jgi:hypothetical protein
MIIQVPQEFSHAGDLSARFAGTDPRAPTFADNQLEIDLRGCQFVRPAAVLWCLIYPLLAAQRGVQCKLLVPENIGVCIYLQSTGLFDLLKASGVDVDDRGIPKRPDPQMILPLTRFGTPADVERIANETVESLTQSGHGAANLYPVVSEIFAELALNAVQHSDSPIDSYGLIQFYDSVQGRRFICTVSDGGIGIRGSLERNPALRDKVPYDWVAIELALGERISSTGDATRGIGLYGVADDMRKTGRQLIIHSGIGMLKTSEEVESQSSRTTLFPGTLAFASIPS